MRRLLWILVFCGATACTALNGAFEGGADETTDSGETEGVPSSVTASGPSGTAPSASGTGSASDPTVDPTDSASDGDPSGQTNPTGPDTSNPTDPTDTTAGTTTLGTGSSVTGGEGEGSTITGKVPLDRVVFVYATAEPWFFLKQGAAPHCALAQPALAAERCEGALRVPLASIPDATLQGALAALEAIDALPVYGIENDGTVQLAESPDAMLDGLDVTLAAAGVNLNSDAIFWTGASENCSDWSTDEGFGSIGVANSEESSWYDAGEAPCGGEPLRLVCGCVSNEFPFD